MDQFEYQFEPVANTDPITGTHASNRLDYVKDELSYSGNYTEDIDNQNPDNYGYDKLGQLIRDNSEGSMLIEWFSGNRKVKKITRSGKTIEFKYNPFGQRLLKTVTDLTTGTVKTSYYAYDANGQVMGVYEVNLTTSTARLNELNIYGASRLGMIDKDVDLLINGAIQAAPVYPPVDPAIHTLGWKKYEIVNYLGNVNAVITDRKLFVGGTYEAVVIMNSDYYPFGMEMPKRHTNEGEYRFGYNGMELDNEAKGNGNSYTTEFRQYDPRLGCWLSLDPLMAEFPWMSPYVAFDDNPVYYKDLYGLSADGPGDPEKRTGTYNDNRKGIEGSLPTDAKNGDVLTYTFEGGDYEKVEYKRVDTRWEVVKYRKIGDRYSANSQRLQNHPKIPPPEGEPILIAKEVPPTPEITTDESGDGSSTPPNNDTPPPPNGGEGDTPPPPPPPICTPVFTTLNSNFKVVNGPVTAPLDGTGKYDGKTPQQFWNTGNTPLDKKTWNSELDRLVSLWQLCNSFVTITISTMASRENRNKPDWSLGGRSSMDLQVSRGKIIRQGLIDRGIPESAFSQPNGGWLFVNFNIPDKNVIPIKITMK